MAKGHSDIATLLAAGAATRGDAVAIMDAAGRTMSYAALDAHARHIAACLRAGNFRPDDRRPRFGIVIPNGADIAVVMLGAAIAGEATPFNSVSTAAEFAGFFAATHIDALIVREGDTIPAVSVAEEAGIPVIRIRPDFSVVGLDAPAREAPTPSGGDIALVLMTSGSTGRPKIVPLTHRNVCCSAEEVATSIRLGPEDVCLTMWEQFHIGGLVDLLLAPLASGGRIIATGGFNAAQFFALLKDERPTWYQAVPTTLNELVQHAERHGIATKPNSLRLVRSVAAALSPALMERAIEIFDVPVIRTFGMTEASPLITSTPLPPLPQKPGSVGKSCGTQIAIMGPDGVLDEVGAEGQVAIRGENVFAGYEGDDEANAASFRDGWFLTGDLGYVDAEGDLFLTGRIKQMINRGGEKISPQEVDDVLAAHPAVAEVATFAVPHRTLGEDVAAAVVLRTPTDPAELRNFARRSLATFKVPRRIIVMDRLPRNPVGKIDRLVLAKSAEAARSKPPETFAAPANAVERLLAVLWAQELNLPQVDVHLDFTEAGGDSLSMTRILLATEAALGCEISPDLFAENSTIAAIAAQLATLPILLDGTAANIEEKAAASLQSVSVGTVGHEETVMDLVSSIETCADRTRLRVFTEGAVVYATASELAALLEATEKATVASKAVKVPGAIEKLLLERAYRRWRRDLRAELESRPRDRAWLRRILSKGAFLYGDPTIPTAKKRLVVGFTGNLARLMQPTYRVLAGLDPRRFDLLLLRDPAKSLFVEGGPGLGHDMPSVCAYANDFFVSSGYAAAIALGTSGGAPAAIHAGLVHGWERSVAISSPAPSVRPEIAPLLADAAARAGAGRCPIIVVYSSNPRDVDAARALLPVIPFAEVDHRPDYSTHNILHEAHDRGEIEALFAAWFDRPLPDMARGSA